MKILQINSSRKWIGEASHTFSLFKELVNKGIPTILICKKGWSIESYARKEGLEYETLALSSRFNIISDFKDFFKLRRIIKQQHIDLVHTHRSKEHWLSALTILTLKRKPKLVRTRHVVTPIKKHIFNRWLFGTLTDAVICVSKKVYEQVSKLGYVKNKNRIKVIYSGIDTNRFCPDAGMKEMNSTEEKGVGNFSSFRKEYDIPQDAILIGLVGRLQRIKGQEIFLNVAKVISKKFSNAHFLIAGKGKKIKEDELRILADKLSISDKVTFLGYVDAIEKVVSNLDIGVIASLGSEGSSRIAMEYMASGLPIVATKVGGIPEILSDGTYGVLVKSNSTESLADGVIRLLNDKQKMDNLKIKVRERATSYFNFDRWIGETVEVYKGILGL